MHECSINMIKLNISSADFNCELFRRTLKKKKTILPSKKLYRTFYVFPINRKWLGKCQDLIFTARLQRWWLSWFSILESQKFRANRLNSTLILYFYIQKSLVDCRRVLREHCCKSGYFVLCKKITQKLLKRWRTLLTTFLAALLHRRWFAHFYASIEELIDSQFSFRIVYENDTLWFEFERLIHRKVCILIELF